MSMESTASNLPDNNMSRVLNDFMCIEGVEAVALVGRDGFVIDSMSSLDLNMDALGAMVATSVGTSESLGKELNLGSMSQYMTEFTEGKVIMAPVKDDILAVFTNKSVVIGSIRYAIAGKIPKLASVLH
ncbi:MAG: roadblock/LC7 domain-containing protein [Gammaproteobacteria bacterium]|nr:roadblock/LC7 domain-containing protein [Gammaproteobacteria bacterium]